MFQWDNFKDNNLIAIGWDNFRFKSKQEIFEKLKDER